MENIKSLLGLLFLVGAVVLLPAFASAQGVYIPNQPQPSNQQVNIQVGSASIKADSNGANITLGNLGFIQATNKGANISLGQNGLFPAVSTVLAISLIPLLGLIGLWFLIALVIFLVKMLRSISMQDVAQKKAYRAQTWWVLAYPIVALIVFATVGYVLIVL